MGLLADVQIDELCRLPKNLTNFESFLNDMDKKDPSYQQTHGKSRVEEATYEIPNCEPLRLAKAKWRKLSVDVQRWCKEFVAALKPYEGRLAMIDPYIPHQVRVEQRRFLGMDDGEREEVRVISYGLSSYGYDARLSPEIKTFTNINGGIVDPKEFEEELCVQPTTFKDDKGSPFIVVPSNGFVLGSTIEYFRIANDITVICLGKSTYARTGLVVNVTPLEAGWEGNVTLELSNTTPLPIKVYLNEGICQFLFFRGDVPCEVSYADRNGKYQGQQGVTLPRT